MISHPTLNIPKVAQEIILAIKQGQRFLMVPHQHIDGDDLGCMIGLALALREQGKEVYLYSDDSVPERFQFLEGHELVTTTPPTGRFDAVFVLECPDYERLPKGLVPKQLTDVIITLDHHEDNPNKKRFIGNINWVDESMSALGEMIALLVLAMDLPLSDAVATAIYTAIVSDSCAFRFHNISERTHLIVAELMHRAHINTDVVHFHTIFSRSRAEETVTTACKESRTYHCSDKIVFAELNRSMLDQAGLDSDGAIQNLLFDINNEPKTEVLALFKDLDNQNIRVSLRSRRINVLPVAQSHNGGGHKLACAMKFPKDKFSLAEAQTIILDELEVLVK